MKNQFNSIFNQIEILKKNRKSLILIKEKKDYLIRIERDLKKYYISEKMRNNLIEEKEEIKKEIHFLKSSFIDNLNNIQSNIIDSLSEIQSIFLLDDNIEESENEDNEYNLLSREMISEKREIKNSKKNER